MAINYPCEGRLAALYYDTANFRRSVISQNMKYEGERVGSDTTEYIR